MIERMHSSGPTDRFAIEVNKKLLKKRLRMNSIIEDIVSAQELHEADREVLYKEDSVQNNTKTINERDELVRSIGRS